MPKCVIDTLIVKPFTWAQCCQVYSTAPDTPPWKPSLRSAKKKKTTKKKTTKKGSIIFYRSSPVALTRERRTSIIRVEDVVKSSQWCVPSLGSPLCAVNLPLVQVWVSAISSDRPAERGGEETLKWPLRPREPFAALSVCCCLPG